MVYGPSDQRNSSEGSEGTVEGDDSEGADSGRLRGGTGGGTGRGTGASSESGLQLPMVEPEGGPKTRWDTQNQH